ncbi:histone promoter control protein Hpc2 [Schizosaccharomyces japonicus yFS275]|uniref:Histone promoter control protein Hpc2 n=1 Tax=Schizosaccharomyces japonicus (strain yFS275 / FY16936) TaxID=402676 RepID=B6K756_SCHJY|nr:histone promoter control protein Hpc2 [Schizosaccharomyces japonicus yFS275]EEB09360.1 histone promoter control protein Hpc2 [Schizosaccharomyces japonicus yFS275]
MATAAEQKTLVINIPLAGRENVHINYPQEVEKIYGPMEDPNADKKDLSDSSDSEGKSDDLPLSQRVANAESANGQEQQPKKRKRRRYADLYYDRSDPFIDDTELYIEEMAAASKDGFFVFSGPLVAEGEKIRIERTRKTKRKKRLSTAMNATPHSPVTTGPTEQKKATSGRGRKRQSTS